MNGRHDCFCSGDVIVDLQPLEFERIDSDDGTLVYRAEVQRLSAPGSPVFALTMSALPPDIGREQAEEQFSILRSGILADFLLTAPKPDGAETSDEGDDGPDSGEVDLIWDIHVVPSVLRTTVEGKYGAEFVAQAPIPGVLDWISNGNPGGQAMVVNVIGPRLIRARIRHIWEASSGTTSTTVTSNEATQYVNPGNYALSAGDSQQVNAKRVTISNYGRVGGRYTMTGRWNGPTRVLLGR